jgi:Holliday junction resolvase
MASNYARGRGLEYRVKAHLEAHAWHVTRAASSKGSADLVASKGAPFAAFAVSLIHVSCKLGRGGAPPAERVAFYEASRLAGARPLLAWQRKPRAEVDWYVVDADGRLLPTGEPT